MGTGSPPPLQAGPIVLQEGRASLKYKRAQNVQLHTTSETQVQLLYILRSLTSWQGQPDPLTCQGTFPVGHFLGGLLTALEQAEVYSAVLAVVWGLFLRDLGSGDNHNRCWAAHKATPSLTVAAAQALEDPATLPRPQGPHGSICSRALLTVQSTPAGQYLQTQKYHTLFQENNRGLSLLDDLPLGEHCNGASSCLGEHPPRKRSNVLPLAFLHRQGGCTIQNGFTTLLG